MRLDSVRRSGVTPSAFVSRVLVLALFSPILFSPSLSRAQSIDDIVPDFTPEEQADIGKAFGTFSSASVVFTGRNAASTGNFSSDDGSSDISIVNIPITHTFGEEGDQVRIAVRGAIGTFESRTSIYEFFAISSALLEEYPELAELPNYPDFRKDEAISASLGTGVTFEPTDGLTITPAFDLIWTHVKRRFDYNNLTSAIIGLKYDRELFNNSTESITYAPNIGVAYELPLGCGYRITPSLLYTHLWTHDLWSKSEYASFSIDSGVLQGAIELNVPLPFSVFEGDTDLRPFFKITRLSGAVKDSLDEDRLYDMGADLAFDVESEYIDEIFVGGAYITASDFDGYRISLTVDW